MAINVIGQVFFGTPAEDHLRPGFGDNSYVMTADNFVTDTIDGGGGRDTVNYSSSQVGVEITLTDPVTAKGSTITLGALRGGVGRNRHGRFLHQHSQRIDWHANYLPPHPDGCRTDKHRECDWEQPQ